MKKAKSHPFGPPYKTNTAIGTRKFIAHARCNELISLRELLWRVSYLFIAADNCLPCRGWGQSCLILFRSRKNTE